MFPSLRRSQGREGTQDGVKSPTHRLNESHGEAGGEAYVGLTDPLGREEGPGPNKAGRLPARRSAEENLAQLIQTVHDGWNKLKPRSCLDGVTAEKYVLMAHNFSWAYDVIDHRMLRLKLLQLGLPASSMRWVWAFIRDRRCCGGKRHPERWENLPGWHSTGQHPGLYVLRAMGS